MVLAEDGKKNGSCSGVIPGDVRSAAKKLWENHSKLSVRLQTPIHGTIKSDGFATELWALTRHIAETSKAPTEAKRELVKSCKAFMELAAPPATGLEEQLEYMLEALENSDFNDALGSFANALAQAKAEAYVNEEDAEFAEILSFSQDYLSTVSKGFLPNYLRYLHAEDGSFQKSCCTISDSDGGGDTGHDSRPTAQGLWTQLSVLSVGTQVTVVLTRAMNLGAPNLEYLAEIDERTQIWKNLFETHLELISVSASAEAESKHLLLVGALESYSELWQRWQSCASINYSQPEAMRGSDAVGDPLGKYGQHMKICNPRDGQYGIVSFIKDAADVVKTSEAGRGLFADKYEKLKGVLPQECSAVLAMYSAWHEVLAAQKTVRDAMATGDTSPVLIDLCKALHGYNVNCAGVAANNVAAEQDRTAVYDEIFAFFRSR